MRSYEEYAHYSYKQFIDINPIINKYKSYNTCNNLALQYICNICCKIYGPYKLLPSNVIETQIEILF